MSSWMENSKIRCREEDSCFEWMCTTCQRRLFISITYHLKKQKAAQGLNTLQNTRTHIPPGLFLFWLTIVWTWPINNPINTITHILLAHASSIAWRSRHILFYLHFITSFFTSFSSKLFSMTSIFQETYPLFLLHISAQGICYPIYTSVV